MNPEPIPHHHDRSASRNNANEGAGSSSALRKRKHSHEDEDKDPRKDGESDRHHHKYGHGQEQDPKQGHGLEQDHDHGHEHGQGHGHEQGNDNQIDHQHPGGSKLRDDKGAAKDLGIKNTSPVVSDTKDRTAKKPRTEQNHPSLSPSTRAHDHDASATPTHVQKHVSKPLITTAPKVEDMEDEASIIAARDRIWPPANNVFQSVPDPQPTKPQGLDLYYQEPLTHMQAFYRASWYPNLAARTLPSAWFRGDDPLNEQRIVIRGKVMLIPDRPEQDPIYLRLKVELERAEAKFKATRREKHVGGELNSIMVKRIPEPKARTIKVTDPAKIQPVRKVTKRQEAAMAKAAEAAAAKAAKEAAAAAAAEAKAAKDALHKQPAISKKKGKRGKKIKGKAIKEKKGAKGSKSKAAKGADHHDQQHHDDEDDIPLNAKTKKGKRGKRGKAKAAAIAAAASGEHPTDPAHAAGDGAAAAPAVLLGPDGVPIKKKRKKRRRRNEFGVLVPLEEFKKEKRKLKKLKLKVAAPDGEPGVTIDKALGGGEEGAAVGPDGEPVKKKRKSHKSAEEIEAMKARRERDKKMRHAWKVICRQDVPKAARLWTSTNATAVRQARSRAVNCVREARKIVTIRVRNGEDASKRSSKRLIKDVMSYWKKDDKERAEKKKREVYEMEQMRRREEEEREAQRQKNKLRFLLGQSEAFSSFLQKKREVTSGVQPGSASATAANGPALSGSAALGEVTGNEDDEELMRRAEHGAAALVAQHKARLEKFDLETRKRRKQAAESSPSDSNMDIDDENKPDDLDNDEDAAQAVVERANRAVEQPTMLVGKMKGYQLRGLAWLVSLYDQGINGMLADEMGLGKTIQTISFLAYLAEKENNWGPFLVVSPKATLHNWQQEIAKFCPDFKVLPYWGNRTDRQELRKTWSTKRMYRKDSEFHVCVTSYDILVQDEKHFPRVKWQYVVLDEAQAIKNSSSSRWKTLLNFPCRNRLLLTGTPLQNKLSELWSLLHFMMPTIFDSHAEFAEWFAKDIEGHASQNTRLDQATVARLRTLLDPFMLRRVKRDVENEMPPKVEVEVPAFLTPRQRLLYNTIKQNISVTELLRSVGASSASDKAEDSGRLMNIVMQLRKVCNHPETFERRQATSPFQFQAKPPRSFIPPPPSVLTTANSIPPPIIVKFIHSSNVHYEQPKLLQDLGLDEHRHAMYTRNRLGLWSAEVSSKSLMASGEQFNSSAYSIARLSGGYSFAEMEKIMCWQDALWMWHDCYQPQQAQQARLEEVYADEGSSDGFRNPCAVPHRLVLSKKQNHRDIILPGFDSPAEIVERSSRFLRTCKVHVPSCAAPSIVPHIPGWGQESVERNTRSLSRFVFPDPPHRYDLRSSKDYYSFWRELLDVNYGELDGSSIVLPDAGRLVVDSGKMKVLDVLLARLKAAGHKCLVYSQFTRVLDILEDYCAGVGYKFVRLDGQSALADRRDMVADWQTNPDLFVFLLSTRAGGVGINLTAADTVIFFDSDWNPTVDAQAMDRAHRLGQDRPVTVYRLIAKGSVEDRILQRARQKDRIHELVIKGHVSEVEADVKNAELQDVATLLLDEEDINMKAKLAGDSKLQAVPSQQAA